MKPVASIGIAHTPAWEGGARGMRPFLYSGILHGIVIAGAVLLPGPAAKSLQLADEEPVITKDTKIIWYPLQQVQKITPIERIGTAPVAQGREKQNLIAIHEAPTAKSGKQTIYRPDSPKEIEREIPAPNLVAIEAPAPVKPVKTFRPPDAAPTPRPKFAEASPPAPVPAAIPPATVKAAPDALAAIPKATREFVAPPEVNKKAAAVPQAQAPAIAPLPLQANVAAPSALTAMPKVTRQFVPPPVSNRAGNARSSEPAAPVAPAAGLGPVKEQNSAAVAAVLNGSGPARPKFALPPSAQGGGRGSGGPVKLVEPDAPTAEGVNAAVLNTAPLDKLITAIPEGARSVQMSAAPNQGAPSSGPAPPGSGMRLPGVAVTPPVVASAKPPAAPKPEPNPTRAVYEETRNLLRRNSLLAPLHPSSRIIPQLIESRFRDRDAYSLIIARPKLPAYAADWVLWFAEKTPRGGAGQMRAPLPLRKLASGDDRAESGPGGTVQFAATILKSGQLDSVIVLSGPAGDARAAAIHDLESWQFSPALRDGEAVDVEIILEIQFQSEASVSSSGTVRH